MKEVPVRLTTTGGLHPADAVQAEDSITVSAVRCAAQAMTTDPSGRTTAAGEVAVWPAGDTATALDHPAGPVRTLARTCPAPVHATTAVPDACPAVTRAGVGVPFTVPSVTGTDHVVAAVAVAGIMAPATTTPPASAAATSRGVTRLPSNTEFSCAAASVSCDFFQPKRRHNGHNQVCGRRLPRH
jgi:hypothetical protein